MSALGGGYFFERMLQRGPMPGSIPVEVLNRSGWGTGRLRPHTGPQEAVDEMAALARSADLNDLKPQALQPFCKLCREPCFKVGKVGHS